MRRFKFGAVVAGLISILLLSTAASAQVSWSQVKKKAKSAKSYSVLYKYKGPRGRYDFNYSWSPSAIRTEILRAKDRSRVGTVIVWDRKWNPKRIRAKVGGGLIVRKTSHKDVRDTPFHRSIYDMVFAQTDKLGKPKVAKSGNNTLFTFKSAGGRYRVWANAQGEILKTERRDRRTKEIRRFAGHRWNNNPQTSF